jgi:hypothetical protein
LFHLFANVICGVIETDGKFAGSIGDTGGKFATGINHASNTGGKIYRQCAIPLVYLDL